MFSLKQLKEVRLGVSLNTRWTLGEHLGVVEAGQLREKLVPRGLAIAQGFDSAVNSRPKPENSRQWRGGWCYHEVNNNMLPWTFSFSKKLVIWLTIVLCYTVDSTKLVHIMMDSVLYIGPCAGIQCLHTGLISINSSPLHNILPLPHCIVRSNGSIGVLCISHGIQVQGIR